MAKKNKFKFKDAKPGHWVKIEWQDTGEAIGIIIDRKTKDIAVFFPDDKEIRDDVEYDQILSIGNEVSAWDTGLDETPTPVSPEQKKIDRRCV